MAQKKMDARMDLLEQGMEMAKEQVQKLPRIERLLEQMAQNMVRSLQSIEETQKMVAALMGSNDSVVKMTEGEEVRGRVNEEPGRQKKKTLDQEGGSNDLSSRSEGWASAGSAALTVAMDMVAGGSKCLFSLGKI